MNKFILIILVLFVVGCSKQASTENQDRDNLKNSPVEETKACGLSQELISGWESKTLQEVAQSLALNYQDGKECTLEEVMSELDLYYQIHCDEVCTVKERSK